MLFLVSLLAQDYLKLLKKRLKYFGLNLKTMLLLPTEVGISLASK
jgi:hypothetical protein